MSHLLIVLITASVRDDLGFRPSGQKPTVPLVEQEGREGVGGRTLGHSPFVSKRSQESFPGSRREDSGRVQDDVDFAGRVVLRGQLIPAEVEDREGRRGTRSVPQPRVV